MEEWRDIEGFPGYQVSNFGQVRSFWRKRHYPSGYGTYRYLSNEPIVMSQSDDGNGYMKVMLYSRLDGKRYCKKVHRLVAEAFIPQPYGDAEYTVDHIRSGPEGKLDNSIWNLQWITRRENIQKAYRDGVCNERIAQQRRDVIAIDLWTGREFYFESVREAADELGLASSAIPHVLNGDMWRTSHYRFEYAGLEERLLYGNDEYQAMQRFSWL